MVVGQRGDKHPAPPSDLPSGGAYQNTPFTVFHHEQQPILTTLQKHLSVPKSPNRTNFPYQLEQPDPNSASELDSKTRRKDYFPGGGQESIYNIGELPVPPQIKPKILNKPNDSISAKLPIATDRPAIAIAYTPTTHRSVAPQHTASPPPPRPLSNHHHANHYFSMPNYDSAVIPEIHQATTTSKRDELESFHTNDYYEKDFQAPFHPSVNLDGISDSYAGWAILDRTTNRNNELELGNAPPNEIDRRDKNKDDLIIGDYSNDIREPSSSTDGFQLEGGFRPIVPPHLMDVDHAKMTLSLEEDMPVAEKQISVQNTIAKSTAPIPVMAKDTAVDISAESSLQATGKLENDEVGDDEVEDTIEYDDEPEEDPEEEVPLKVVAVKKMDENEIRDRKPELLDVPSTTEKVMSFEDALSAIFGLNDEGIEEDVKNNQPKSAKE